MKPENNSQKRNIFYQDEYFAIPKEKRFSKLNLEGPRNFVAIHFKEKFY